MTTARLIVAIVAIPALLTYAGGLLFVAIVGLASHRQGLDDVARRNRVSPIAMLLVCALCWPVLLARILRDERHG